MTIRSSRPEVFSKKGALKNFAKLTGKHLCQMSFPLNFTKFLRTSFFREHLRWLLLEDIVLSTFQKISKIYHNLESKSL